MRTFLVDFLPVTVKEAKELRKQGGAIVPLHSWKLKVSTYYEAYNKVLEDLRKTEFALKFEDEYKKPLGITHIQKYLEISVEDDKRFTKPKGDYIKVLEKELQERRNKKQ